MRIKKEKKLMKIWLIIWMDQLDKLTNYVNLIQSQKNNNKF